MTKLKWEKILSNARLENYEIKHKTTDIRTEFENDYERIVFSAAFRRLQDKAQVFPLEKFDFVRTRLTHSLEVSATAKALGRSIGNLLIEKTKSDSEKVTPKMVDDMCTILSCAGLIHDIGNPPFGHFGETAIREWFEDKLSKNKNNMYTFKYGNNNFILSEQEANDFLSFEGNAQALRLLIKLPFVIDENGMNLTKGVLNSIIKYPVSSVEIDKSKSISKKPGFFASETKLFNDIVNVTELQSSRNPLVYILEAADDISYLLGDLEDAFNKGLVSFDELKNKYSKFIEENKYKYKSKEQTILYYLEKNYDVAKNEYGYEDAEEYSIKSFIYKTNKYLRDSVVNEFIESYDKIMNGNYEGDLLVNCKANKLSEMLRSIAKDYIYNNKDIVSSEIIGYNMITYLLDTFVPIVLDENTTVYKGYKGKIYSMISKNYRFACQNEISKGNQSEKYYKLLLVTDFICGMTDSYAAHVYKKLKGMEL